jgi:hypothetical protein
VPTYDLLRTVLRVEVLVILAALVLSVGHTVFAARRAARWRPLVERLRAALAALVDGGTLAAEDRRALERLSPSLQTTLFVAAARDHRGAQREALTALAHAVGVVQRAEAQCASGWWWRRLYGARVLSLVGGGDAGVAGLFSDPHPEVRAQAAVWAAQHLTHDNVARLLGLLTDPSRLCRFSAQNALLQARSASQAAIADYLARGPQEGLNAALQVATRVAGPVLRRPAHDLAAHASPSVRELAAALLAALGAAEDVSVLLTLLDDQTPAVRAAAVRGLGALAHWAAGPRVAVLLRDRSWQVRREAALALRRMGAPGMVMLRRTLTSDDAFARDMARQVLDVTGVAS